MTSFISNIVDKIKSVIKGPMTHAEVDRALADLAANKTERLAWQSSIVDLLKLLELPYTMDARETLAGELGFVGKYSGSSPDNARLYQLVMDDVAKRCIHIPPKSSGL